MSRLDIVAVALRVFAVFLLLTALQLMGAVAQLAASSSFAEQLLYVAFTVVPFVAIAALLWFFPLTIASKFLPVAREPQESIPGDLDRLQEVAFTVVGLWVLATGVADSVYWVTYLFTAAQSNIPLDSSPPDQIANIVATAAQVVLGAVLMLRARGLIGALRRFREAGHR